MKFTTFDKYMRQYEESLDQVITKGNYIIARLDGRNFHTYAEYYKLNRPFDYKFANKMARLTRYLMEESKFNIVYGYTQSDEISLLFNLNDDTFGRKVRKINSILASYAGAYFNMNNKDENINDHKILGVFDCRVISLPNKELVKDYFMWRQEDCARNCLNSYCYWTLREYGFNKHDATEKLKGMKFSEKHDLLYFYHINFNTISQWCKRGIGIYNEYRNKKSINKYTHEDVFCKRRYFYINEHLEYGEPYGDWIIKEFC